MENLGPAGEFLRISEHYRRMTDGELLILARQTSELTEMAQQALAGEISQRKLKVEPDLPDDLPENDLPKDDLPEYQPQEFSPALPVPDPPTDSAEPSVYDEDRQLVTMCTVWSLPDALQVQALLDSAGIPFVMGIEKATRADKVTSNFAEGVPVGVMQIGVPWARAALEHYEPRNAPAEDLEEKEIPDLKIRCPKCRSTEIVFEDLIPDPTAPGATLPKYQWTCDSCGHHWQDEGLVKDE